MGKFIDLTGQRFERLILLERISKDKKTFYKCRCDCGNECLIWHGSLMSGDTKSCGCLQKQRASENNSKNIEIGTVFGYLTVLEFLGSTNKRVQWLCECKCGKKKKVSGKELRNGHTTSCGCSRIEDLTDEIFGRLRVISLHHTNVHGAYWNCECECGKVKFISAHSLKNGDTQSCGCLLIERGQSFRKEYGEASFNTLIANYRKNAKIRNLVFELSDNEFKILTKQDCYYCNKKPAQIKKGKENYGEYIYNGIDRIDSSQGYTIDNCVSCCGRCNEAKMAETQSDFKSWIEKVYNHFVKGENNE